jgi:hypothetical protein
LIIVPVHSQPPFKTHFLRRVDGSFLSKNFHIGNSILLVLSLATFPTTTAHVTLNGWVQRNWLLVDNNNMEKSKKMPCFVKLLMVTDSVFLDQQQARQAAFHGMIDHIAEHSGVATAVVAEALQHSSGRSTSPSSLHLASLNLAKDALAIYLAKRTGTSCPPKGLDEALTAIRTNLLARCDGSGQHMVGVSGLPSSAIERYVGQTPLRRTFDVIYSVSHMTRKNATATARTEELNWIRQLSRTAGWPSASVMKAICALHHARQEEAVLVAADLKEEIGPAKGLGIKTVYLRMGALDKTSAGIEGSGPDGIANRIADLPQLPIFQRTTEEKTHGVYRPPIRER